MIKKCQCGGTFRVMQTNVIDNHVIWRRRMCDKCRRIVYTTEVIQDKTITELEAEYAEKTRHGYERNR